MGRPKHLNDPKKLTLNMEKATIILGQELASEEGVSLSTLVSRLLVSSSKSQRSLSVTLPPKEHEAMIAFCKEKNISMDALVAQAAKGLVAHYNV